jgi:hypothetical protein
VREQFGPPIAYLKVQARGGQTARFLAAERFADSASILDLIERPKLDPPVGEAMLVRENGGGARFVPARIPRFIHPNYVDPRGRLVPPFRQLSRAAAKDEDARSDWERRVLAATRWLSRALDSARPADRLVANMVALECLFIAGERTYKGAHIASRAGSMARSCGHAPLRRLRDSQRLRLGGDCLHLSATTRGERLTHLLARPVGVVTANDLVRVNRSRDRLVRMAHQS